MSLADFQPPLVAILRGLPPADAPAVGKVLFEAGFRIVEVPLNRPGALQCIGTLAALAPPDALIGAGTVLGPAEADAVQRAGGRLIVSPHCNPALIAHAVALGLWCAPGVATPSEAFAALQAGAHALKLFPAEMVGRAGLKALCSVLPPGVPLWPVGGITPDSLADWRQAGATGFGIGGALYQPGMPLALLAGRAAAFQQAWTGSMP